MSEPTHAQSSFTWSLWGTWWCLCSTRRRRLLACVSLPLIAGWTGVIFVRSGEYAPGVFRFSIQFSISNGHLSLPAVYFPPILLHPIIEPISGRLNLLPYLAMAQKYHRPLDPDDPTFFSSLLAFISECFTPFVLSNLCDQWILNERLYLYVFWKLTTVSKIPIRHYFDLLRRNRPICPLHLCPFTMPSRAVVYLAT